jgi:CheY-like chemotaxis protein
VEKPLVLVADDNEATCTLITALLHREFIVETANDGMEAIAKLKSRPYAAILVDLLMPRADGYSVLDFLRSERPELMRRSIVLTASVMPREISRVREYDVFGMLAKPFDIDELAALTRQCATGERPETGARGPLLSTGMLLLLADILHQRWL